MAIIHPYTQQTSTPSGEISVRASAADFGGGHGQGMQQFGETMQNAAIMMDRHEQQREYADAQVKLEQAESMFAIRQEELKKSATPDQPTSPLIAKEMNEYFTGMMGEYKHKAAQQYIQMRASNMTQKFFGSQMQFDVQYQTAYTRNQQKLVVDEIVKNVGLNNGLYEEKRDQLRADFEAGRGVFNDYGNPIVREAHRSNLMQIEDQIRWAAGLAAMNDPLQRAKFAGVADSVGKVNATAEQVAMAIYGQESSSGKADTSKVNSQNVTGPMQIKKETWEGFQAQGVIPKEYDWKNPEHNKDAGFRIVKFYHDKYNGDVEKIAAAYYSGEGAVNKNGTINRNYRNKENPEHATVGEYIQQVVSRGGFNKEIPQGSKFDVENAPAWFKEMDFEKQVQFMNMIQQRANQEKKQQSATLDRTVKDQVAYVENTGKMPPDMLGPQAFPSTEGWKAYESTMGTLSNAAEIARLPLDQQQAKIEAFKPQYGTEEPGVYAMREKNYDTLTSAVRELNDKRVKNGMGFAMEVGFGGDKPIKPITNFQDTSGIANTLVERRAQQMALQDEYKHYVPMLSDNEARGMQSHVSQLTPVQQAGYLKQISTGLNSRDVHQLSRQVFSGDSPLEAAMNYMMEDGKQNTSANNMQIVSRLLFGRDSLSNMPKGEGGKDERSVKPYPTTDEFAQMIRSKYQGMNLDDNVVAKMAETTRAYFVGLEKETGLRESYDLKKDKKVKEAVNKSIADLYGDASIISGRQIIRPFGMDDSTFQDRVETSIDAIQPGLRGYFLTVSDASNAIYNVNIGRETLFRIDVNNPGTPKRLDARERPIEPEREPVRPKITPAEALRISQNPNTNNPWRVNK